MAIPLRAAIVFFILSSMSPLVKSRGCFLGDAEITLANGQRKLLRDVQVGDILASFDDNTGKSATSTVMHVPKFRRARSDIVEIALPSARVYATHDHPFWSRARNSLVSAQPNMTASLYSLEAHAIHDDEELEDEKQQGVGMSGISRYPASARLLTASSSLRGSTNEVEVMTLCMNPHHWYYVHGVRVHNKGCFVPSTPVTLADGSKKELKEIVIGDEVSSWDEALGRPVNSTVMAVPTFQRRASDIVEISLPSAAIHVTHDHPFWSKGRQGLVSLHPNQTRAEYDLDAELMMIGEELQEEDVQRHLPVLGLRRRSENMAAHDEDKAVNVMTLCLQPYHWYYVHGVRVHNKGGCFAPWTPVLMSDYTQKPISEVRENDKVISWDESAKQTSVATVLGIAQFPASDLLEVSLNITPEQIEHSVKRQLHSLGATPWSADAAQLIVTRDHPIYSARVGSVVSMDPSQSTELYGLKVNQMQEQELFRHYLGYDLSAQVRDWNGSADYVMTLRLDRHHWFHVHGVRVHNKGGSSGSSGGGGGGGIGFSSRSTVRSSASSYRGSWIGLVLLSGGSRRRWGTYRDEPGSKCTMTSEYAAESHCCATMGSGTQPCDQSPCYECMDCGDEGCIQSRSGCEDFQKRVFTECEHDEDKTNWVLIIILILLVLCICGCCVFYVVHEQSKHAGSTEFQQKAADRIAMSMYNGVNLGPSLFFSGTYTENGETKPTTTRMEISSDGYITGQAKDDDGSAEINGKLNWPAGEPSGEMRWVEQWPGWKSETVAKLERSASAGELVLSADYISTHQNTHGVLNMTSQNAGFSPPVAGVVEAGVVEAKVFGVTVDRHSASASVTSGVRVSGTIVSSKAPDQHAMVASPSGGQWSFDGGGKWHPFDADVSAKLSAAKAAGQSSLEFKGHGGMKYKVDFGSMIQKNLATGKERAVKEP